MTQLAPKHLPHCLNLILWLVFSAIASTASHAGYIAISPDDGSGMFITDSIRLVPESGGGDPVSIDSTPANDNRIPLLIVHGWNKDGKSAKSIYNSWFNFVSYFKADPLLSSTFKLYIVGYNSNAVSVDQLGADFGNLLDQWDQAQHGLNGRKFVILSHSMGGLISRAMMNKQRPNGGPKWGERVINLITLATPHHGSPLANSTTYPTGALGKAIYNALGPAEFLIGGQILLAAVDKVFGGISSDVVNRSNLWWDNYDPNVFGHEAWDTTPTEVNTWLRNLNLNDLYISRIIAYGGFINSSFTAHDSDLLKSEAVISTAVQLANDGAVPLVSAQFDKKAVAGTRIEVDYDHTQMWQGKFVNIYVEPLFISIGNDLKSIASKIAPTPFTIEAILQASGTSSYVQITTTAKPLYGEIYKLYRNGTAYKDFDGISFQDGAVTPGMTYSYYAVGTSSAGTATSNTKQVTIPNTTPTTPAAPSNLVATAVSSSKISLSWRDNSSIETSYIIQRKIGSTGTYADIVTSPNPLPADTQAYYDPGLAGGNTYFYRVKARGAADSAYSNETSALTPSTVVTTRVLMVNSLNTSTGPYIYVGPSDVNGQADGNASFTRQYTSALTVTLVATANWNGSVFQKWQKDGVLYGTSTVATVAMDTSHTMTAVYAAPVQTGNTYSVTVSASPSSGGSVVGNGSYQSNAPATVQATPASGYTFWNWTVNSSSGAVASTSSTYPFNVTGNISLVANFVAIPTGNQITTRVSPANSGTITGGGNITLGQPVTVTATAQPGYSFGTWTDQNGTLLSFSSVYTFTPAQDMTLTANFNVAASGNPDLVPLLTLNSNTVFPGSNVSGSYSVKNIGSGSTNPFNTFIVMSSDGVNVPTNINSNPPPSVWYSTSAGFSGIPSGVTGGGGGNFFQLSQNTRPGQWYLWFIVDPENVAGEPAGNRANNHIVVPFTVLPLPPISGPDLVPHDFSLKSAVAFPGGALDVKGAIRNAGNAVSTGFNFYVSISTSATVPPDKNALNCTGAVPGLGIYVDAGASTGLTLPANIAPGDYYLWIMVDPGSTSGEPTGNQGNNNIVLPLTVAQPLPTYTVNASVAASGGGTVSGGGPYSSGALVPLVASPSAGYGLLNWTENGNIVSSSSNYSFIATNDRTVVANFVVSYTVTPSAGANGTITPSTVQTVNTGGGTTFTATPNNGYVVDQWLVNNAVLQTGGTSYTATNVTANMTVQVTFKVETFSIATSSSPVAGGGTSGGGTVNSGSSVTVVATPNAGYRFVNWTEGGSPVSATASYNFTASASRTLVANFTPITYTIATSSSPVAGGGTSGGGTVNSGSSVTVVATPNAGYSFVNWTEGGVQVSTSASYNFTASASRTLLASFVTTASLNANLASLLPSAGTLSPTFASGTLNYTATVAKSALYYTVTPTVAQAGATVTVNGTAVTSGTASGHIPLSVGSNNVITIAVTAPAGGSPQIYTITVTRANVVPSRDWSGDAKPDLVFQNNAGQLYQWALDGSGRAVTFSPNVGINSFGSLYTGGLSVWRVVGVADVNGDGIPDLVFQNGAGQIYAWFLDGTGNALNFSTGAGLNGHGFLYSGGLAAWRVVGVSDLNGDGNPDLLFQNSVGQLYAWFLDRTGNPVNFSTGAGLKGHGFLYTGALGDWRVVGVADVNEDGNPDILFQNRAGQLYAWFLNGSGATVNFSTRVGLVGDRFLYTGGLAAWRVAGIMDVNGDNLPDLVFQNNAGQLYAWFLDGSGTAINFGTSAGLVGSVFLYTGGLGDWRMR